MSKRILYLCGGRSFRAERPGRKLSGVVRCWRSMGHEVLHVCGGDVPGGAPLTPPHSSASGYPKPMHHEKWYCRLGLLAPVKHSVSEFRDIHHDKVVLSRVLNRAESFHPNLIWERSCRLHNAGLVVAKELGIPYVLEWKDHLIDYRFSCYRARALAMEEQKNCEATFVVVESEFLRDQLALNGVDPGRTFVACNAVDVQQFHRDPEVGARTRRALGVKDDESLVGYLGSYAFYHDTKRLVLAADILKRRGNHKIKILMVGDGLQYHMSHSLARRRGLLDSSILTMQPKVPPEEVPEILSALDIAVLPGSTDIICPIKVQEYMAAELPTVLPDYPANREVITHGETGLLFTPKDEKALAEALMQLAGDQVFCSRMGKNASKEVRKRFTWEKTWGAALESILQRIERA